MERKKLFSLALCASMLLLFMVPMFATPSREGYTANALYERRVADTSVLIEETIGNPEYMDPHVNYESAGSGVHEQVYETLFYYPFDSASTEPTVPLLAESVDISADGLNYTFTLRQGITFHDGTPFNASCVKYNFERVMALFDTWGPGWMLAEPIFGGQAVEDAAYEYGEGSPQHEGNYTAWAAANDLNDGSGAITVLDTYTILIRLAYPYAAFIPAITYRVGSIISPTFIEANGGVVIGEHNEVLDEETCGTGPYMLTEWTPDEQIVLEINPDYWRADATGVIAPPEHAGSIQTVIIKTNEDVNSRILNIQAGETDVAYWPTSHADQIYNGVTGDPGDGTLMSSIDNLKLWAGLGTFNVMFLGFNMNPYINQSNTITESPFTGKNIRYSLSYAFNYSIYIDEILNGFGLQLQGPVPQGMFGHDDDLFMFEYNLTAAVEWWNLAMAEDGLDDVWANNSYSLTIYYNSGNTNREKACLMMKDGIDAIIAHPDSTDPSSPLTIDVQALEWASYLYQVRNRQLPIFFLGWAPDYADPDNYVGPFVKSTGTYPLRIGLGQSEGWNATHIDGLISDAAQSLDSGERIDLYEEIQETIVDHAAFLWVYQSANFHVEHENVYGYVFNPMFSDPYWYHYYKVEPTTTTTSTSTSTTTANETTSSTGTPEPVDMTLIYVAVGAGVVVVLLIVVVVMRRR
jgi:peptide/nickel transport system substrate-binding protein